MRTPLAKNSALTLTTVESYGLLKAGRSAPSQVPRSLVADLTNFRVRRHR